MIPFDCRPVTCQPAPCPVVVARPVVVCPPPTVVYQPVVVQTPAAYSQCPNCPVTYVVQGGEDVSKLAIRYNCSFSSIMKANRLTTTVKAGQVLLIP